MHAHYAIFQLFYNTLILLHEHLIHVNFYNKAVSLEICLIRLWNVIALLKTKNEKRNEGVAWHFKSKDNKPSCTAKKKNPFFIGTWPKLPIKNVHLTKNNYFYLDIRTFVECILNVGVFCLTAQVESKKPKWQIMHSRLSLWKHVLYYLRATF